MPFSEWLVISTTGEQEIVKEPMTFVSSHKVGQGQVRARLGSRTPHLPRIPSVCILCLRVRRAILSEWTERVLFLSVQPGQVSQDEAGSAPHSGSPEVRSSPRPPAPLRSSPAGVCSRAQGQQRMPDPQSGDAKRGAMIAVSLFSNTQNTVHTDGEKFPP